MPERVIHIILNPKSAAGRGARMRDGIEQALRERALLPVVHMTNAPGHAAVLASHLAAGGADMVVAAGGDGTIHDVANGILTSGHDAALALLPLGTGNDFAKVVPGARHVNDALDTLARPAFQRFDVGHATWDGGAEFFINGMGTGIDVQVVREITKLPAMPGPVKYLLALLKALAVYQVIAVAARIGERRIERRIMMMAVGNGICQGGGFYLTPQALPADGSLDLCIVAELPLWKVPLILPLVLRGTHTAHPAVTMARFERIRFEAQGSAPLYFQLDGELREPPRARWLDVEVRAGALKVVTAEATTN